MSIQMTELEKRQAIDLLDRAVYFTNHRLNRDSFLLACGYALPEREMQLHEDEGEINWKE